MRACGGKTIRGAFSVTLPARYECGVSEDSSAQYRVLGLSCELQCPNEGIGGVGGLTKIKKLDSTHK
jgi:hypothetical protein